MKIRLICILTMATLMSMLASCGVEKRPTGGSAGDGSAMTAETGAVISFWSPAPAGKTLGGGTAAQDAAEKAAELARKADEAEKAVKEAEKAGKKAVKLAEKAAKEAENAAKNAPRADRESVKDAGRDAVEAAKDAAKDAVEAAKAAAKEAEKAAEQAAKAAEDADADAEDAEDADAEDDDAEDDDAEDDGTSSSESLTATRLIGPEGGKIELKDRGSDARSHDDLTVRFHVPEGSLDEATQITMTVHGRSLSTLQIEFGPANTQFDPPAKLQVHLGKDLVDLDVDDLRARHTDSNGKSENVKIQTAGKVKRNFSIQIEVSSFSRYSLGN